MQTTLSRSQNIFSALSFHTIAAIPLCGLALLYYNHTRSTPLPSSTRAAIIAAGHSAATSHLRLSDTRSFIITLRDGRQLGYADLGSPTGTPIFALHGTPGSRIDYEFCTRPPCASMRVSSRWTVPASALVPNNPAAPSSITQMM